MRVTQELLWVCWNIFLASIPVGLAYGITAIAGAPGKRLSVWAKGSILVLGAAWLTFLPNTCYLLTEWRHFLDFIGYTDLAQVWQVNSDAGVTLAVYTLFYFCYSGIGMLAFALAIRPIVRLVRRTNVTVWVWAILFFLLMSLGVYLGLILRFNSWDLLDEGGDILSAILSLRHHPVLTAFIIGFAGFLWLAYIALDIWVDGFALRWKQRTGRN